MQTEYRRSLIVLGLLIAMVLLIACANVANLMTAQAAARQREMALRISIGAGRLGLLELLLMKSAWVAAAASALGAAFALWAAPFVVARINPSQTPAQLALPLDWRVTLFAALLTFAVAFVCAFAPSLRVSEVEPAQAHKGEERQSRGRLTKPFDIAKQVTAEMSFMTAIGIGAGLAVGFATVRFIANLLYEVKSTDPSMTITPILVIAATVVAAALPAVIRAVRIDPASMLRVE